MEDRLRKLEDKVNYVFAGGTVLFLCCLAFFSYENWIGVPDKVRAKFAETIGKEKLEVIEEAEATAEKLIQKLADIKKQDLLTSTEGDSIRIRSGVSLANGSDWKIGGEINDDKKIGILVDVKTDLGPNAIYICLLYTSDAADE